MRLEQSAKILRLFSPTAVGAIRATIVKEEKWLAATSDQQIKMTIERNVEEGRANARKSLEYLAYVADCLQTGRPITREHPHIKKEDPKSFEDRVPIRTNSS